MLKSVLLIIFLVCAGFTTICLLLYARQRSMLYYPTPEVNSDEASVIYLDNEEERLKIWYVPATTGRALLYFGGNAEDVSLNISQFKRLFPHHSLFLMNYRGYGGSSGKPTEDGFYSDALALYDHARLNYADISVIGRSLGTGIAVFLASQKKVTSLVLVTPFDSMVNLASVYYPYVPVSLLLKDRYESSGRVSRLDMPILAVIAEYDDVIPRQISDPLVSDLDPEKTRVTVIKGATHNSIGSFPSYENELRDFFK